MGNETEDAPVLDGVKGAFAESLFRNNKKIRRDRAEVIIDDAKLIYRREVEDIEMQITRTRRDRDNMLDLSPTTTESLVMPSNFNAKEFVQKDIELGMKIRNLEITLDIARARYKVLFGE